MLNVGITGQAVCRVDKENTAAALGSGMLEVFATPAMISLIERAACESVQPYLEVGCGSVGPELRVKHLAATPVGMTVTAKTELIQVEGRRLVFRVEAFDEASKIGEGEHERFIIQNEKFLAKAQAKAKKD